ncbi:hypothetical protein V8C86DRAFT_2552392 [Haematococcus lacustris]
MKLWPSQNDSLPRSTRCSSASRSRGVAVMAFAVKQPVAGASHDPVASSWLAETKARLPWMAQLESVREGMRPVYDRVIPGIRPVQTRHSNEQGVTAISALDGSAAFQLHTFQADPQQLRWMFSSTGVITATASRPFGTALVRMAAYLPDQGPPTPNLEMEIGTLMGKMEPGVTPHVLANFALTPRLDPVLHATTYLRRYYTAVPPALPSTPDAGGSCSVLSFDAIHARVTKRVAEGLYQSMYKSPSVYSRVLDGTSLGFIVDCGRPEAMQAMQEELADLSALWAAWRQWDLQEAGSQGQAPPPGIPPLLRGEAIEAQLAARCQALAHYLEVDPGTKYVQMMFGQERMQAMLDTCSGKAAVA